MTTPFLCSVKLTAAAIFVMINVMTATSVVAQEYIILTKGGGVTGNTTVFRISDSGEVAKGTGTIEPVFSEFAHLRKGKTKKFFRKTTSLLKHESFNKPGNIYTAIALEKGGKENKLVWGDQTEHTPVKAKKLYEKIEASLNKLTFSKNLRK